MLDLEIPTATELKLKRDGEQTDRSLIKAFLQCYWRN